MLGNGCGGAIPAGRDACPAMPKTRPLQIEFRLTQQTCRRTREMAVASWNAEHAWSVPLTCIELEASPP